MTRPRVRLAPGFAERVAGAFGVEGTAWIAALPALVVSAAERWGLDVGAPFDLSYAYVAGARTRHGEDVVLKAAFPGDEARRQIAALRLYDGVGACRLVEADDERCVLLLERARPGDTLERLALRDDDAATAIAAGVMRALWRPAPAGDAFPPLATWFEAFARYQASHAAGGPLPAPLVTHAATLAHDLLASTTEERLLHGDLHHGNILDAGGRWLAIDPKGVVGDPGYEAGPLLLNPLRVHLDGPLLRRRLEALARALEYDPHRLRDWGVAHAVLSACWSIEDHAPGWERAAAAAELLATL